MEDSVFILQDSLLMVLLSFKEFDFKDFFLERELMFFFEIGIFKYVIFQFGEIYIVYKVKKDVEQE